MRLSSVVVLFGILAGYGIGLYLGSLFPLHSEAYAGLAGAFFFIIAPIFLSPVVELLPLARWLGHDPGRIPIIASTIFCWVLLGLYAAFGVQKGVNGDEVTGIFPFIFGGPFALYGGIVGFRIHYWVEEGSRRREEQRRRDDMKEADAGLERVNANITDLEKRKKGFTKQAQALLDRKGKAEMEIANLTAIDPANLGLKVKELRRRIQSLSENQLSDRRTQLDYDLQEISNAKQRARKELVTLESDASKQENRLRELDRLIKGLEMKDPSNIRLQGKVLSNEWLDLSETELEAVPVKNELSGLLKEFHILKRRIQRIRGEMDTVRRRIDDTNIETILTLEKIVLDMEQASRTPQPEKEQISKIEADLQSLYAERNTLEQGRGNYR
jgi:predicted  nucleic acid-binding Zn-ribbon protein